MSNWIYYRNLEWIFFFNVSFCQINTCLSRIVRETHNRFHWNWFRSNSYKELLRIRIDFSVLHGFVTTKVFNVEKRRGVYSWGRVFRELINNVLLHISSSEKIRLKPFVIRKRRETGRFIMIKWSLAIINNVGARFWYVVL
jgi:hypothetical protein